ncbi:MAG: AI-2E family transporter [Candidatus Paceibacterota bacterium]
MHTNRDKEITNIRIDSGTIIRVIVIGLLFVGLYILRDLLFIIFAAVVIASAIEPAVSWFNKKLSIPRLLGVIIIYLSLFIFIFVILYFFIPPVLNETIDVIIKMPEITKTLNFDLTGGYVDSGSALGNLSKSISLSEIILQLQTLVSNLSDSVVGILSKVFGGALSFMLVIVMSFYLAVQEKGIHNFLRIVTPFKHEKYIIDLWGRSQKKIGRWMQGQMILALIVAILVYLGLTILGIENALILALLAGAFEIIPLFGPILSSIPAIAIAFLDGGITLSLMVIGLYIIIQQFENHLIYPLVVKKVVGVPALVVIIALIVGAKFAGFIGMLLSVPIVSILMEYANDLDIRKKRLYEEMEAEISK